MYFILLILNILDYILTLCNRGKFVEANPLMVLFLDDPCVLAIIKLLLIPAAIFVLYRNRHNLMVKIMSVIILLVYVYAVTLGILILIDSKG